VLELPNSDLGSKAVGLWARTLVPADGAGEGWVQADRGALPAQSVFLPGEENAAYLSGNRRTMPVSSPSSRTRWSTRVGIRRRKQGGLQGNCCRTSCVERIRDTKSGKRDKWRKP
jgi:hypothetical protein